MTEDSKAIPEEVYYIDLDALLDTRIGVIATKSADLAAAALQENYWNRKQDVFPGITKEQFQELWNNRTSDVLPLSPRTNILAFVQAIAKDKLTSQTVDNLEVNPHLVINTHPYELSDEECNILIGVLVEKTAAAMNISVVNLPNELLTPKYCKDSYAMMVRYDWMSWLAMHTLAFEKTKMPGMSLIVPCLFDRIPTNEEIEEAKRTGIDFFRAAEKIVAPLFSLRFLDIHVFSMDDVFRKVKKAA